MPRAGREMTEASGSQWCARFPTSRSLDDLADGFREKAVAFTGALADAGAGVVVSATYRPVERAYLMHWCWAISRGLPASMCPPGAAPDAPFDPASVPALEDVDIDWTNDGDRVAARVNAGNMVRGYGMAFPAALTSRHTQRLALDMTIRFGGVIQVKDARGIVHPVKMQTDLWPIGASYGVFKLASDPPHWSSDGH